MWPFKRRQIQTQSAPAIVAEKHLRDPGARRITELLSNKDWAGAREILLSAPTPEHFAYYVLKAADSGGLMQWIDDPIRDEPDSVLPLLIKGARGVYWAWEARGEGGSSTVSEEQWKVWFKRLKGAEDCLDEVVERDPSNVEARHWLITLARARQVSKEERWRRFNALAAIDPLHYYGNSQMLECVKRKWSGSDEDMLAFARERAAMAPGTALPSLVADAHRELHLYGGDEYGDEYMVSKEVGDELVNAAEQSIWHPSYQRTLLTPLLWNTFAFVLAMADRLPEAKRCFDEIGDDLVLERTWSPRMYVAMRDYATSGLDG